MRTAYTAEAFDLTPGAPGGTTTSTGRALRRTAALLVMWIRVPIAALSVYLVAVDRPHRAVLWLVLFVVLDVYDGRAARWAGIEDASRRIWDVVIDRTSVHALALTACLVHDQGWWVWSVLISHDIAQAVTAAHLARTSQVVVAGAMWHRAYGLATLAWGSALITDHWSTGLLGSILVGVAVVTALDYLRVSREVVR